MVCLLKEVNAVCGPDSVLDWGFDGGVLTITTSKARVSLTSLAEDLVRMTISAVGGRDVIPTGAVVKKAWPSVPATVSRTAQGVCLSVSQQAPGEANSGSEVRVKVGFSPLQVKWYHGGRLFATDEAIEVSRDRIAIHRVLEPNERFYGLGQKMGFLDRRGRKYEMWATDDPLHTPGTDPMYQSIPFLIGLRKRKAHGLFVDCAARSFFDLGSCEPAGTYSVEVLSPVLDAYVFAGPSMRDIIVRYTELTGRMELPPLWALGYHQCRYSYYPEARVREVAKAFREKDIPCDAIWLDIHYMDGYRVFTWDKERFPDPEGFIQDLAREGFKVVTIVDPGIKVDPEFDVYREGLEERHFITNPDGTVHVGEVWPGPSAFPDFLRHKTRSWWGKKLKEAYVDKRVAGIWLDMNEPASFRKNLQGERTLPHDVLQGEDGRRVQHKDVHNLYGFTMSQAAYDALRRYAPENRPFILTRSGYAGIQRYAAVWMGDNHSWWEHLLASMPLCMGMGLSGVPFAGVDVGGFGGDATAELYARWMEMGAFMPFFRGHTAFGTRDQEPWSFGPEVEDICRRYIKLRYRLLPLFYTLFEEASRTGLPVIRPLILEEQDDERVENLSDEFLLGRDILVAPVYLPGQAKRLVYLPRGEWYDFWTGRRYRGGRHIIANAPLDIVPVFVRAGGVMPMGPEISHTNHSAEPAFDGLTLHVFAGEGVFELYEDEGDGYAYRNGAFARTRITVTRERIIVGTPRGDYKPPWRRMEMFLHGFGDTVSVDGEVFKTCERSKGGSFSTHSAHTAELLSDAGHTLRLIVEKQGGFAVDRRRARTKLS